MDGSTIAATKSERLRTIDYLKRKARSVHVQAGHAAPALAVQLKTLAHAIEAEATLLENSVAG